MSLLKLRAGAYFFTDFIILLKLGFKATITNILVFSRLVLINAIYFKGDWATKFDAHNTRKGDFHLSDGSKVQTDLMYMAAEFRSAELPEIDATALELPYKGDRLAMILVLPNENLAKTESMLADFDLGSIQFKRPTKFEVTLPKFKIESTHDLNEPLKKLGLTDMFDETVADFSGEPVIYNHQRGLFHKKLQISS